MSSEKCRPFFLGLSILNIYMRNSFCRHWQKYSQISSVTLGKSVFQWLRMQPAHTDTGNDSYDAVLVHFDKVIDE